MPKPPLNAAIVVTAGEHETRDEDWCTRWCVANRWKPATVVVDPGDGSKRRDLLRMILADEIQVVVCVDPAAVFGGEGVPRLAVAPASWALRPRREPGRRTGQRPEAFR